MNIYKRIRMMYLTVVSLVIGLPFACFAQTQAVPPGFDDYAHKFFDYSRTLDRMTANQRSAATSVSRAEVGSGFDVIARSQSSIFIYLKRAAMYGGCPIIVTTTDSRGTFSFQVLVPGGSRYVVVPFETGYAGPLKISVEGPLDYVFNQPIVQEVNVLPVNTPVRLKSVVVFNPVDPEGPMYMEHPIQVQICLSRGARAGGQKVRFALKGWSASSVRTYSFVIPEGVGSAYFRFTEKQPADFKLYSTISNEWQETDFHISSYTESEIARFAKAFGSLVGGMLDLTADHRTPDEIEEDRRQQAQDRAAGRH